MRIFQKRWIIFVVPIVLMIGLTALFMSLDSACSPIRGEFCRQWLNFQWETVLAGALGLTGGIFVITSSRAQIEATNKHRADEATSTLWLALHVVNDLSTWSKERYELIENQRKELNNTKDLAQANKKNTESIKWGESELKKRCAYCEQLLDTHGATSFDFEIYRAFKQIVDAPNYKTNTPDETQKQQGGLEHYKATSHLEQAWIGADKASIAIKEQIKVINTRCGIEN